MQVGELTVGVFPLDLNRTLGRGRCVADIGDRIFKTFRLHDLGARWLASHQVADWLTLGVDIVLHVKRACAAVDIDIEIDAREHRIVHLSDRRSIH